MALVRKRSTLKIWGDVIFAIFLREIKSTFNDKFGISWAIISPMIMIIALVVIRNPFDGGVTHSVPTIFFVIYGVVLVQFFLGTFEKSSRAIQKNKALYAFRQVQPISSVIAISGFQLLVTFFLIIFIGLLCFVFRIEVIIFDPIEIIFNVIRIWLCATSLGLLFSLAACYVPEIEKVKQIITRPLFFISGIFFSMQDIPQEYWHYLNWNPLLHAVELTRYAAYPSYGDAGVSYFYLDLFTLISVFFALACYHIGWKQAISR